jgi:hypothetical protein
MAQLGDTSGENTATNNRGRDNSKDAADMR